MATGRTGPRGGRAVGTCGTRLEISRKTPIPPGVRVSSLEYSIKTLIRALPFKETNRLRELSEGEHVKKA